MHRGPMLGIGVTCVDAGATITVKASAPITMSVVAFHVSMGAGSRITLVELRVAETLAAHERLFRHLTRLQQYGVPPDVVVGTGTFELTPELGVRKDEDLTVKVRNEGKKPVNFAGMWLVERPGDGHKIRRSTLHCTLCHKHVTASDIRKACKPLN